MPHPHNGRKRKGKIYCTDQPFHHKNIIQIIEVKMVLKLNVKKINKTNDDFASRIPSHLHIVMSFDSGWNKQRS